MATAREDITLRSGQAEVFRKIMRNMSEERGYDVQKTEVIGHLIEHYNGPYRQS